MDIAFDCYLGEIVRASRVDASTEEQPYRFICAYCRQSVIIAAQDSEYQRTHFRHKHGNNETECENYLGRIGQRRLQKLTEELKRFYKKSIDFYFSKESKRLYLGVKFSKEEIEYYQEKSAEITIGRSLKEPPFFTRKINKINFATDCCEKIGLDKYSEHYSICIDNEKIPVNTSVINCNRPSFFRINENSEESLAKYVKGDTVYTKNTYYILKPSGNNPQIELKKISSVEIIDSFTFKIGRGGETIYVVKVRFNENSDDLRRIMRMWGMKIENSEKIDLLWPPAVEFEDNWYLNSKRVYLQSTFTLESNKNINANSENISNLFDNLYRVNNEDEIKIMCKNIDFSLKKQGYSNSNEVIECKVENTRKFTVPDNNQFYFFSEDGVKKLNPGRIVYLTPSSKICEYYSNYMVTTYLFEGYKQLTGEELFRDILANSKQLIPYDFSIENEQPEFLREYLSMCEDSGVINAVVARFIKEGKF